MFASESFQTPRELAAFLRAFAKMAQASKAPPDEKHPKGYPQKDGWGMSLCFRVGPDEAVALIESLRIILMHEKLHLELHALAPGLWLFLSSLLPIWTQADQIARKLELINFSSAKMLAHARAADKPSEIGKIQLNMPFKMDANGETLSFAFNGRIKVHLPKLLLKKLGLEDLMLENALNGAQRLAAITSALIEKNMAQFPKYTLQELVTTSLSQLENVFHERVGEVKIVTITGCNIIIQGSDFTYSREFARDGAENTYYSLWTGPNGIVASAPVGITDTSPTTPI